MSKPTYTATYPVETNGEDHYLLTLVFWKKKGFIDLTQFRDQEGSDFTTVIRAYCFIGTPDGEPNQLIELRSHWESCKIPSEVINKLLKLFVAATQTFGENARPSTIGDLEVGAIYKRQHSWAAWWKVSPSYHRRILYDNSEDAPIPLGEQERFYPNEAVDVVGKYLLSRILHENSTHQANATS